MKTVPSPNADLASETARSKAFLNSDTSRTTRMPRPPPPIAALMITRENAFGATNYMRIETAITWEAIFLDERVGVGPLVNSSWRSGDDRDADFHS